MATCAEQIGKEKYDMSFMSCPTTETALCDYGKAFDWVLWRAFYVLVQVLVAPGRMHPALMTNFTAHSDHKCMPNPGISLVQIGCYSSHNCNVYIYNYL